MSPLIIKWLCFSERKSLQRRRLVKVIISRRSWRKTRETKPLGSMQIAVILSDTRKPVAKYLDRGQMVLAVLDYIIGHTHVALRSYYGS